MTAPCVYRPLQRTVGGSVAADMVGGAVLNRTAARGDGGDTLITANYLAVEFLVRANAHGARWEGLAGSLLPDPAPGAPELTVVHALGRLNTPNSILKPERLSSVYMACYVRHAVAVQLYSQPTVLPSTSRCATLSAVQAMPRGRCVAELASLPKLGWGVALARVVCVHVAVI